MANWPIPEASRLKYADLFRANDFHRSNFLNGAQAKSILLQSGLTEKILSQIWTLADVDNDGQLSSHEFILAMHLIDIYKADRELPLALSYDLLPPSLQNTSPSSSSSTTVTDATVKELDSDFHASHVPSSRVPNDSLQSSVFHHSHERVARSNSSSSNSRPSSGGKRNNCDTKSERDLKSKERRQSRYAPRPGYCLYGSKIRLLTNHYALSIPERCVHMYDLSLTPITRPRNSSVYELILDDRLKTRFVRDYGHQIFSKLLKNHPELFLVNGEHIRCVYDGARTVYACERLEAIDSHSKNLEERPLIIETDGPSFEVKFRYSAQVDLKKINDFVRGKVQETPQEPLKAIEIIINYALSQNMVQVQRSFFPQQKPSRKTMFASANKLIVSGHSQSCKITELGPTLNVDKVSTLFHSSGPILTILEAMTGKKVHSFNCASNNELASVFKQLIGLKAYTNHGFKRSFKLKEITLTSARDQIFTMKNENGEEFDISVEEYFKSKYRIKLKYPEAFCIKSGSPLRPVFYPIEVIEIAANQPAKKISAKERTRSIFENSKITPKDRLRDIEKSVEMIRCESSDIFKHFSMNLSRTTISIDGYQLSHPTMKYGSKSDHRHSPSRLALSYGKWDMNDRKVLIPGRRLNRLKWIVVNLSKNLFNNGHLISKFIDKLISRACEMGMRLREPIKCSETNLPYFEGRSPYVPNSIRFTLEPILQQFEREKSQVNFILFIFEDKNDMMYRDIKFFCDVERGINNQCITCKNVSEMNQQSRRHLFANMLLQINTKLGGINGLPVKTTDLESILNKRTLILGADVSHPTGLDPLTDSTSSVTASMDDDHYFYECSIRVTKKICEVIRSMKEMVYSLLQSYYKEYKDRKHPERIIFFRDGVSESMFDTTLAVEVQGIRDACQQISHSCRPAITVIVAQKRHSTRLFNCEDRSTNVASGTLVDSKITHSCDFDYYLCSHDSTIGTSRPTHYTVILDENYISPDTLYNLTFHLCHTYAPATRSISIPAPILYAHLSAKRTRHHLLAKANWCPSEQRPFCHERVKSKMYFI